MGYWSILVPEATTNLCVNPSFETNATGWSEVDTLNRQTPVLSYDIAKFGAYSYRLTLVDGAADATIYSTAAIAVTATITYRFSCYVYITSVTGTPSVSVAVYNGAAFVRRVSTNFDTTAVNAWQRLEVGVTIAGAGETHCYLEPSYAGAGEFGVWYIDGIQFEAKSGYCTSYCDGDQPGCAWNGALHGSTSSRSALSRAGGRLRDLTTDYYFYVTGFTGSGLTDVSNALQEFPMQPGGETANTKEHARSLTLVGFIEWCSVATFHSRLQDLMELFSPSYYPNNQPVTLQYSGGAVTKEIQARYEGGLEESVAGRDLYQHNLSIRLLCDDPYWYEVGESAAALDPMDSPTLRYLGGRLKATGQWDDLGLTANPDADGAIAIILVASDGAVYFGGNYTDLNNTGTNMDMLARYTPSTDTWSLVGAGAAIDDAVWDMAEAPNGDIYVAGQFTNLGGANGDLIAMWDVSAAGWAVVGDPTGGTGTLAGVLHCCCIDKNGILYVGGDADNIGGVPAADNVAQWSGAAWAAVGAPAPAGGEAVYCMDTDSDNNLYIGGNFANFAGVGAADYAAVWDGAAWAALPGGTFNGNVYDITISPADEVYIGGAFTNVGDANGDGIVMHNGVDFVSLGTGLNGTVYDIEVAPDGIVYAAGEFTIAGGTTVYRMARWNGAVWTPVDVVLSGAPSVRFAIGRVDPVINTNYDVWIGCDTTGAGASAGVATITNAGTANAYPRIEIARAGGTYARLISLRNETLGRELWFNTYNIQDGERLTIYTDPEDLRIHSSYYGDRTDIKLKGDDWGDFYLKPGANVVSLFVYHDTTLTAHIIWRDTYASAD